MANTLSGSKLYVCATAQNADIANAAAYAALTWVQVGGVSKIGETGSKINIVTYNELSTKVAQKNKGIADAGSPEIEVSRLQTDAGQVILRTIGDVANKNAFAFKFEKNDAIATTNTIHYQRGICVGPTRPNGSNEDFDVEVFMLGLVQTEITVNAT